jgi:hypothetical protein
MVDSARLGALKVSFFSLLILLASVIRADEILPPVMHAESPMSRGNCNTIGWDTVSQADEYFVECSSDSSFGEVISNSGWIMDTDYDFCGLTTGQQYWYRTKAQNLPDLQTWMQITSNDFSADVLNGVDIYTLPDNVILAKQTVNSSDTVGGTNYTDQYGAEWLNVNFFECTQDCTLTSISAYLGITQSKTLEFVVYRSSSENGTYSRIHLNTLSSGTGTGWYASGPISVSLQAGKYYGIGVSRSYYMYTTPYANGVGAEPVSWGNKISCGNYSYPAPYTISNENKSLGYYQRYTTVWQEGYEINGNITSTPVELPASGSWSNFYFSKYIPYGTNLTVDILDNNNSVLFNNVTSGIDLSGIAQTQIKFRANLSTEFFFYTPKLHNWSVKYFNPSGAGQSGWSNIESSKQTFPSDLWLDGSVNFEDFAVIAAAWLSQSPDTNWNEICDIAEPANNLIDANDLNVLAETWLYEID